MMSLDLIITSQSGSIWYNSSASKSTKCASQKKIPTIRAAAKMEVQYIHPIFVKMADYIDDPFWKNIFLDISKNKPKRGFLYYANRCIENGIVGKLTYKSKSPKEFTCYVYDDPKTSALTVKDFMIQHAKILSDTDKKIREEDITKKLIEKENQYIESWSEIRNNLYKCLLITRFIDATTKAYNLTDEVRSTLEYNIRMGISSKMINSKSIIMNKGSIIDIKGISYKNGIFLLDPSLKLITLAKDIKPAELEPDDVTPTTNSPTSEIVSPIETKHFKSYGDQYKKFLKSVDGSLGKRSIMKI